VYKKRAFKKLDAAVFMATSVDTEPELLPPRELGGTTRAGEHATRRRQRARRRELDRHSAADVRDVSAIVAAGREPDEDDALDRPCTNRNRTETALRVMVWKADIETWHPVLVADPPRIRELTKAVRPVVVVTARGLRLTTTCVPSSSLTARGFAS